jgi:signal transduction histidine kinase
VCARSMRLRYVIGSALALCGAFFLIAWIGVLTGVPKAIYLENVGWAAVAAAAAACAFGAAVRPQAGRARISFAFLGAGMLAWAVGQAIWTVYVIKGITLPYPSLSDIGYLSALPLLMVGVLAWPRRRPTGWTAGERIDCTLAAGAFAIVSYTFVFEPVLESGVSGLPAWLAFSYPAVELGLAGLVAMGLLFDRWADRGRVAVLGLGRVILAAADSFFVLDAVDGATTMWDDAFWPIAFGLVATASLLPQGWPARVTARIPGFLPAIVVTALLGIAAVAYALRELGQQGWQAADAVAVGFLLVLVATRVLLVARAQARQNALLEEAQSALHEAQRSRDLFLVELMNAQERGARQIADLLHDDVVQQLTALGFRLELEAQKTELPRLRELSHDTGTITASIRGLLVELHPAILDGRGLAPAIDVVAEGLRDRGIDVRVTPFPHRIQRETETLAYRLVQGALANVLTDPHARTAEVELGLHDGILRGRISYSGSGLEPAVHTSNGISLLVARKRTELAGGRYLLNATPGRGTDIAFELPVPDPLDAAVEAAS